MDSRLFFKELYTQRKNNLYIYAEKTLSRPEQMQQYSIHYSVCPAFVYSTLSTVYIGQETMTYNFVASAPAVTSSVFMRKLSLFMRQYTGSIPT